MPRPSTPLDLWRTGLEVSFMLAEAQAVIAMRMLGMAGFWSVTPSENSRMVSEKSAAFLHAATSASRAAMAGKSADQITAAAVTPLRRKTRANSRRLAKRGPKLK